MPWKGIRKGISFLQLYWIALVYSYLIIGIFAGHTTQWAFPAIWQILINHAIHLRSFTARLLSTLRMGDFVANRTLHQRRWSHLLWNLWLDLRRCDWLLVPTIQITKDALCRYRQHRMQTLSHHACLLGSARATKFDLKMWKINNFIGVLFFYLKTVFDSNSSKCFQTKKNAKQEQQYQ